jgi:hypothetical protein
MAIEGRKNLEEKLHRQTLSPKMNQSDLDNEPFAGMWKEREDTAVFSIRRAQEGARLAPLHIYLSRTSFDLVLI